MIKVKAGHYRHETLPIEIENMPRTRLGRDGWAAAGWALRVDGREVGTRYGTMREAVAASEPEIERATLAEQYEQASGKSAAGLTTAVLRSLLAAPAGSAHGAPDFRGDDEPAEYTTPEPAPTRQVGEIHDGRVAWRVGDRCRITNATFTEAGDVWRVETLNVPEPPRKPYAGLVLHSRVGGLGLGETRTAVGLSSIVRTATPPVAPRGTIRLSEALLSAARTGASSHGQFVEYNVMRAALRAAFETVGLAVDDSLHGDPGALGTREHWSRTTAGVLRALRDDHLTSWLRTCIENDESMGRRDRETDPERYPMHAADFRTMIEDVARENGLVL